MTDKHEDKKKVVHQKGEFQLEFPDGTPVAVKMALGGLLKAANEADFIGGADGVSDVAQYGPKLQAALPYLLPLLDLIDGEKFIPWIAQNFSKDKALTTLHLQNLVAVATDGVIQDPQKLIDKRLADAVAQEKAAAEAEARQAASPHNV